MKAEKKVRIPFGLLFLINRRKAAKQLIKLSIARLISLFKGETEEKTREFILKEVVKRPAIGVTGVRRLLFLFRREEYSVTNRLMLAKRLVECAHKVSTRVLLELCEQELDYEVSYVLVAELVKRKELGTKKLVGLLETTWSFEARKVLLKELVGRSHVKVEDLFQILKKEGDINLRGIIRGGIRKRLCFLSTRKLLIWRKLECVSSIFVLIDEEVAKRAHKLSVQNLVRLIFISGSPKAYKLFNKELKKRLKKFSISKLIQLREQKEDLSWKMVTEELQDRWKKEKTPKLIALLKDEGFSRKLRWGVAEEVAKRKDFSSAELMALYEAEKDDVVRTEFLKGIVNREDIDASTIFKILGSGGCNFFELVGEVIKRPDVSVHKLIWLFKRTESEKSRKEIVKVLAKRLQGKIAKDQFLIAG